MRLKCPVGSSCYIARSGWTEVAFQPLSGRLAATGPLWNL